MSKWLIYNKKENYEKLNREKSLSSIQKLILANRDITEENTINSFIDASVDNMYDPYLLKDMDKAVSSVFEAMIQGKMIRIIGDYDADGVSATSILMKGLGAFYDDISYSIPDRVEDGYGLSISLVDKCIEDGVELIITCDNGIAAFSACEYAKDHGIDVIITDHHQVIIEDGTELLPEAVAIVNPSQKSCNYPFKSICGAVVAYKLVYALYIKYGEDFSVKREMILDLLEFASIGTIADMMDIVDENRIIVIEGLKRLNNTKNLGLIELLRQLNWQREIDVYTIGFVIGPTINATGRLFTAKLATELFLDNDISNLREYAAELISLNSDRKDMTKSSLDQSVEKIIDEKLYENDIIILYNKDVHESICGLVAGRVKDMFSRPTIVLTDSFKDDQEYLKGSGRSIEAYDMHAKLSEMSSYFIAFGGHKMACGLTIKKSDLDSFVKDVNSNSDLNEEDFLKIVNIDAALNFNMINFSLILDIDRLKPYGKGFEKPKFASKSVIINNIGLIGKNRNVLKMQLSQGDIKLDAISFSPDKILNQFEKRFEVKDVTSNFGKILYKSIDIVFTMSINSFNGKDSIQLIIEEIR